MMYNNIGFIET